MPEVARAGSEGRWAEAQPAEMTGQGQRLPQPERAPAPARRLAWDVAPPAGRPERLAPAPGGGPAPAATATPVLRFPAAALSHVCPAFVFREQSRWWVQ